MSYKAFTSRSFKINLVNLIKEIENSSLVEIVVISKPKSYHYNDNYLWASFGVMAVAFTFMMFAPIIINMYLIYIYTMLSFIGTYLLLHIFPFLGRLFISKSKMARNVDIYGRAIFQKAGIRYTQERIGVLFYISYFEKMVYVIPDRGAFMRLPEDLWAQISKDMNSIFHSAFPASAFLKKLEGLKEIFAKYIPPIENDINELPDKINVNL